MGSRPARVAWWIVWSVLRAVWISTMVLTPLFGFWLASSLAAYQNATQWLALLVGLLLFPILPLGWDLIFVWRRSKQPPRKAILTRLDRLVLRTLIVNGVFLAGMMWLSHQAAFRALAVRGDWFLDGHDGAAATTIRGWILRFADRFDQRRVTDDDRYGDSDAAPDPAERKPEDAPKPAVDGAPKDPAAWPLPVAFDPQVTGMPEAAQTSVEAVGKYLAEQFRDKKQLVKALHDYVVQRLHYDDEALRAIEAHDYPNIPSQEADAVFARRAGVCAGYAHLMTGLGKAAGVEIAYLTGYIRDSHRRVAATTADGSLKAAMEGYLHAWNAAKIDDQWYLIDATWDDPTGFPNTTTYLFPPPQLMALNHLPEDPAWQLLASPISLGDFVRQPFLSPAIGEFGLVLEEPNRSQVSVSGTATVVLHNPRGAEVSAIARRDGGGGDELRCSTAPTGDHRTTVTCELPDGEFELQLFAAPADHTRTGSYTLDYVGSILVNSR